MVTMTLVHALFLKWHDFSSCVREDMARRTVYAESKEQFVLFLKRENDASARVKARRGFASTGKAEEFVYIVADGRSGNREVIFESEKIPCPINPEETDVWLVEARLRRLGRFLRKNDIHVSLLNDDGLAVNW